MANQKKGKSPFANTKIAGGKAQFFAAGSVLPVEIKEALNARQLTLVDSVLYSARFLKSDTTIELMQASDTQREGITNVNNRKLEASQYMLLNGIRLQAKTLTEETETALTDADFASVPLLGVIANGELDIVVAGKNLFPRNSCQIFNSGTNQQLNGYFALDCPKLIVPQAEIVPTLRLNHAAAANTAVRLELHGVKTVRG
jgi:hypothetical protein